MIVQRSCSHNLDQFSCSCFYNILSLDIIVSLLLFLSTHIFVIRSFFHTFLSVIDFPETFTLRVDSESSIHLRSLTSDRPLFPPPQLTTIVQTKAPSLLCWLCPFSCNLAQLLDLVQLEGMLASLWLKTDSRSRSIPLTKFVTIRPDQYIHSLSKQTLVHSAPSNAFWTPVVV